MRRPPWFIQGVAAAHGEGDPLAQRRHAPPSHRRAAYGRRRPAGDQSRGGGAAAHAATTLRQRAPTPSQQEKPEKREADQRGQDQQRQQQQEGPNALIEATTSPDLIWLEQPTRRDQAARPALAALQRAAIVPLRQQLALEEASFAAVLEREQHPAADPAAAAAGAQRGGAPAPSLVPPGEAAGDGRLRAAPPHDTFAQHEPSLAELVQLAALCRKRCAADAWPGWQARIWLAAGRVKPAWQPVLWPDTMCGGWSVVRCRLQAPSSPHPIATTEQFARNFIAHATFPLSSAVCAQRRGGPLGARHSWRGP